MALPKRRQTLLNGLLLVRLSRPERRDQWPWVVHNDGDLVIRLSSPHWHHGCSADHPRMEESHGHTLELKAILVVDDDEQLATALQWILADEKFLVDVALNGEEALLKVKVHEYNVIICDMKMPRMRGDEFYLKARAMRPSVADRFIFITGFATDPHITFFFNRHEVKYLVKPFPIEG